MAKIVHVLEAEVIRVDNSLLLAGSSTTSSGFKPNLLALLSKNLRRRDAFSQDILDVRLKGAFAKSPNYLAISLFIITSLISWRMLRRLHCSGSDTFCETI